VGVTVDSKEVPGRKPVAADDDDDDDDDADYIIIIIIIIILRPLTDSSLHIHFSSVTFSFQTL
jgi:hypothetical protein